MQCELQSLLASTLEYIQETFHDIILQFRLNFLMRALTLSWYHLSEKRELEHFRIHLD